MQHKNQGGLNKSLYRTSLMRINLLPMKHKLKNSYWIINSLIVHNLLIIYLSQLETIQKQFTGII